MNYEQFSTIYKALQSASANSSLNQDNVIEAIKGQLSPDSDAYKEWEEGNFSLDHVFTTVTALRNESKQTLLTCACQSADLEVVDFLLKAGASVNVAVGDKNPFTVAIEKEYGDSKHKKLVDLLIEKVDAHVSAAADENVNNTIIKAVERGNSRMFNALIKAEANVNIQANGMSLLKWAESRQTDPAIKKEDMENIINTLKAPSEEKGQKGGINNDAVSDNLSQEEYDEECAFQLQVEEIAKSTGGQTPENNGTSLLDEKSDLPDTSPLVVPATADIGDVSATSNTPPAPTTGNKTPKKNDTIPLGNDTVDPTASSVNTSPAPTADNETPEKNDATFWSKHKGKIALGATVVCTAGAVAAYMLAYPAVALALTVLAAVILMGAGIAKFCEKSESPDKKISDSVVSGCCNNAKTVS